MRARVLLVMVPVSVCMWRLAVALWVPVSCPLRSWLWGFGVSPILGLNECRGEHSPLTTNKGRKISGGLSDKSMYLSVEKCSRRHYNVDIKKKRQIRRIYRKMSNLGSNYSHRITLRLNDEQYKFVMDVSDTLGVSPSDYLRMCVNTGLSAMKKSTANMEVVGTHEDVKADIDNQL